MHMWDKRKAQFYGMQSLRELSVGENKRGNSMENLQNFKNKMKNYLPIVLMLKRDWKFSLFCSSLGG